MELSSDEEFSSFSDSDDSGTRSEAEVPVVGRRTRPGVVADAVLRIPAWKEVGDFLATRAHPFIGVPSTICDANVTPIEAFHIFFREADFERLVLETNQYNTQVVEKLQVLQRNSMHKNWIPTSTDEMKRFLALNLLMGVIKKPSIRSYWDTDSMLSTPFFSHIMSRGRFEAIISNLHINDSSRAHPKGHPQHDPLFRVRPLYDVLRQRFREARTPDKDLCIDEGSMGWRGNIAYRMYNPSKPNKYHIKMYKLCEANTGYLLDLIIYTGQTPGQNMLPNLTYTESLVSNLVSPYENKGYSLFTDRFYTSPNLFYHLWRDKQMNATGTVMARRKNFPPALKTKRLQRGEKKVYSTVDNVMGAVKWKDKRDVYMLSTDYRSNMQDAPIRRPGREARQKPEMVLKYNYGKAAVDQNDQLEDTYTIARQQRKCWKKILFYLINCAVTNAFVMYKMHHRNADHATFVRDLASALITESARNGPIPRLDQRRLAIPGQEVRLTGRCFPAPQIENRRRKCVVCSARKQRRDTSLKCSTCDKPLCAYPCFRDFHMLKDFSRVQEQIDDSSSDENDDNTVG